MWTIQYILQGSDALIPDGIDETGNISYYNALHYNAKGSRMHLIELILYNLFILLIPTIVENNVDKS